MCKFAVTPHATICLELLSEMPAPWLTVGSFATLGAVVITTRSGDDGGRNTTPVFGVPEEVHPTGKRTLKGPPV